MWPCAERHAVPGADGHHWFGWMPWTCQPIGRGGLAQMFPWARRPPDFPCFGKSTPRASCTTPLKCAALVAGWFSARRTPQFFLLSINIWLYIHIFDYHISESVPWMIDRCLQWHRTPTEARPRVARQTKQNKTKKDVGLWLSICSSDF